MSILRNKFMMATAAVGLLALNANAQEDFYNRDKYESVADRKQPDFDPESVRVGAFIVDSSLSIGVGATDNVFAASGDSAAEPEESDTIFDVTADANARTDWSNHEVALRGRLGRSEYSDLSDESFTELDVAASGRLDVSRQVYLAAEVTHRDTVQPRANYANGSQLDSPIEFSRSGIQLSANYRNQRVQWNNILRLTQVDFDDGLFRNTTNVFEQDFRDNEDLNLTSRLSYAISPNVAVFAQGSAHQTEYDETQTVIDPITLAATERSRDSEGYVVAGGVNFETSNLMRGDIAVGLFSEDKDDEAFEDVDGLSVDGRLEWFPTQLTTVELNAGRRVVDNGIIESPSTLQTTLGAKVDHEFSRQVVGSVYGTLTEDDFQEINRTDDYTRAGAAITYKLNKRVHLTGSLQNISRDSSSNLVGFDPSFSANEVGIALSFFP